MSFYNNKIEAVIFDMDGVLINSEPLWQQAEIETFVGLGFNFTHEMCEHTVGWRVDEVVKFWLQKFNYTQHTFEFVVGVLLDKLKLLIAQHGKALQGVYSALDFFKSKSLPMAIATSSPTAILEQVVDTLNIRNYFEYLCSAQYQDYGKPHPAVFINAARLLKVEPLNCLVIEDSLNGVIAAKAAKMRCLAIPELHNLSNPKFIIADKIIDSLERVGEELWLEL